ncbi:hypothetical protein BG015_002831 [Linnemannia schmuckeri]|uniref:Ion transport domain-containing protein n=1 Tax=Linnemannia schmuckeri TaxID=64567 RepID=A0A9P5S2U7_9FUNG|nr:hypothetical protein BG015_002831 [Linnemannia schmuckeri]
MAVVHPAVPINTATKYTKFAIPKSTGQETHYDLVLGVSTRDLNLSTVEAIIITYSQVTGAENSRSEVITSKELAQLSRIESDLQNDGEKVDDAGGLETKEGDSEVWKWRLHEKVFLSESALEVVIEVRTWDPGCHYGDDDKGHEGVGVGGASSSMDYGLLELHFVEILTDARNYYSKDPRYKEHQPFIHSVDINRIGYQHLGSSVAVVYPQVITGYCISKDGSHVVLATTAGEKKRGEKTYFLQLWKFWDDADTVTTSSGESASLVEEDNEEFRPKLVALMQFPATMMQQWNSDLELSWDGSQLVVLDLEPLTLSPNERKDYRTTTAFYRCDIKQTEVPEGAVAGYGLVRHYPERRHATAEMQDYCGKGQFHIIATTDQDVKDELFVTCNGVSIEIYGVYEEWTHVRSITMNPARIGPEFITNVYSALSKQLHGPYFVVKEPSACGAQIVTTWDIEKGVCVSSFTGLTPEQNYNISSISTMSANGQLIAIPGQRHVDLFWTATWTLAGTCVFYDMEHTEAIGDVQFIRFDTRIMVGIASGTGEVPFYRKNRGYILNTETMTVVERFVSQGMDVFLFGRSDSWANPQAYRVGDSQVSLFDLQDRIIQSPSNLRVRCNDYCTSVLSFKQIAGKKEAISPSSGMKFKVEKITKPIIINGRREALSLVALTLCDSNGLPVHRMSVPLPRETAFRSAQLVGGKEGCSYLLVVLDKLIMIWSTPTFREGHFILRLVQDVESDTKWKICPHNRLYGRKVTRNNTSNNGDGKMAKDDGLSDNQSLDDPTKNGHFFDFPNGIIDLVEIFELATAAAPNNDNILRQDILRYVGKYINSHISDRHLGNSSIVPHICESWTPRNHTAIVLFARALLLENPDSSVRWIPRPHAVAVNGQMEENDANPILCMINKARTEPQALEVAQVLCEYLLRRARIEKDPYFLVPVLQTLQELIVVGDSDKKPPLGAEEFVAQLYQGFASLPARPVRLPIGATDQEQEVQWAGTRAGLGPRRDEALKDLYFASFDMLWYQKGTRSAVTNGGGSGGDQFIARCCYYILVLLAVALQIYGKSKVGAEGVIVYHWIGMFFDILITSFTFLCVEVVQMFRQGLFSYFRSVFNIADLLVLALPFAGSLNHFCTLLGILSPPGQNSGLLSFSVLIVLLHFIFELRVFKPMARLVWSITHGIESIATFLYVYLLGVLGFLTAFLHMIPACPDMASCQNPSILMGDNRPSDFFAAVSGIHLSGRNGWGGGGLLYSDNWANFVLALIFFLFNIIMFINMAIVLIQDAAKKEGQEQWEQEWFKHRLKFVESAENMSYRSSGARKNGRQFPDVVYYSATAKDIREYQKNHSS